jgi:hypothetical protein
MIDSFGDMDHESGQLLVSTGSTENLKRAMDNTITYFDKLVEVASVLNAPPETQ